MRLRNLFGSREVKNASWLIGGRIAQMGLSLVIGIFTRRYLGPANHGLIDYGAAYVAFFSALCNLGLNSVIIKDFVDHPEEQGEAIGSALVMRLVSSLLSFCMILGITSLVDSGEPLTIAVVALCSLGSVFHIFDIFHYWFQFRYQSKITSVTIFFAYCITAVYKIILLVLQKDVRWFALATSIDYIAVAVFLLSAYRQHAGPKLKFSLGKAKALLGVSYHYILSSMMVAVYGQTDKLMLKGILDEREVAYYATATSVCAMWTFVLQAIIDSLYPTILRLSSGDKEAFNRKNKQLYAIVFYVSCFVSLCFVLFGDWGICLLYGTAYAPAGLPLKIVTWYTAFSYLGVARNAWIISEGKQRYLKYMYLGAAVLNVILNCILIPPAGAAGAALASLITQIFTSMILPCFFREMRGNAKLMVDAILLRDVF